MIYDELATLCRERGRPLPPPPDIHCVICDAPRTVEYGCSRDDAANNFILWGVCLECSLLSDFGSLALGRSRRRAAHPTTAAPVTRNDAVVHRAIKTTLIPNPAPDIHSYTP